MKKQFFSSFILGAAVCASQGFASPTDEKLFLEPHLAHLAGKAVFQAGHELAADKKNTFEHALSVNCGLSLPSTTHAISKDMCRVSGLAAHLHTVADSLKENGVALVTAPASYGTVFTCGNRSKEEILKSIHQTLDKIGASEDVTFIASNLNELKDVTRATFAKRAGKLALITDEKSLGVGEMVWRKNPTGASQEIFHSEEEFLVAIRESGLVCEEIKRPCFFGEVKWQAYNKSLKDGSAPLGVAYRDHNPFTIYKVVKKAA